MSTKDETSHLAPWHSTVEVHACVYCTDIGTLKFWLEVVNLTMTKVLVWNSFHSIDSYQGERDSLNLCVGVKDGSLSIFFSPQIMCVGCVLTDRIVWDNLDGFMVGYTVILKNSEKWKLLENTTLFWFIFFFYVQRSSMSILRASAVRFLEPSETLTMGICSTQDLFLHHHLAHH